MELDGPSSTLGAEVQLDSEPGAAMVAMRADGTAAVVVDDERIYGVIFGEVEPEVKTVSWPKCLPGSDPCEDAGPAVPVGIDRTASDLGDIFGTADITRKIAYIVGFDNRDNQALKPVGGEIVLTEAPVGVCFGKTADLYVASASGVIKVNPYDKNPTPTPVAVTPSAEITSFVVQR